MILHGRATQLQISVKQRGTFSASLILKVREQILAKLLPAFRARSVIGVFLHIVSPTS